MTSTLLKPHNHPGKLIVVEGIDGSGKSTQALLLRQWLESLGQSVFFTEWNSSSLVKKATKAGKKQATLTPITFSLLHATDFADRHFHQIVPPLKAGMIVVADRYAYTAFARDLARGVDAAWLRNTYSFATRPDVALYFRVPTEIAVQRIVSSRAKLKFYEAGMDLGLSPDIAESFRIFQGRVNAEYDKLVDEFGLIPLDATQPIHNQQRDVRRILTQRLQLTRQEALA